MSDDEIQFSDDEVPTSKIKKRKTRDTDTSAEPKKNTKKNTKTKKKSKNKYDDDDSDDYYNRPSSSESEISSEFEDEGPSTVAPTTDELDNISSDEATDEYDSDFYKDEEDRRRLAALPDIERQAILFERSDRINTIRTNNKVKAELRARRAQLLKSSSSTKPSAPKTAGRAKASAATTRKKQGLTELKARREKSAETKKRVYRDDDDEDEYTRITSDDDEEDNFADDEDYDKRKSSKSPSTKSRAKSSSSKKTGSSQKSMTPVLLDRHRIVTENDDNSQNFDEQGNRIDWSGPVTLHDVKSCIASRDLLVSWLEEPFWDKYVPGLFVRVHVGIGPEQTPIYRLAEILDSETGDPYQVPVAHDPNKGPLASTSVQVATHKTITTHLKIAIGKTTRSFRIDKVSNRPLEESEFIQWKQLLENQMLILPSKKFFNIVSQQIKKAKHYVKSAEDIEKAISRKKENQSILDELNVQHYTGSYLTPEVRQSLQKKLDDALSTGNDELIANCRAELDEFDTKRKAYEERYMSRNKHHHRIREINARNRQNNSSVEASYIPESAIDLNLNPFARRPTMTVLVAPKTNPTNGESNEKSTSNELSTMTNSSSSMDIDSVMDTEILSQRTKSPSTLGLSSSSSVPLSLTPMRTGSPLRSSLGAPPGAKVIAFSDYLAKK